LQYTPPKNFNLKGKTMANPGLVRAGLKIAKAVAKKRKQAAIKNKKIGSFEKERLEIQASKIGKTRANSTNNINTGPVDRAIKRTKKIIDRYEGAIDNYTLGGNPGTKLNVPAPGRMHRGLQKAKALKNNLGFKRLQKKMGIK
jgi:hypothetical protein